MDLLPANGPEGLFHGRPRRSASCRTSRGPTTRRDPRPRSRLRPPVTRAVDEPGAGVHHVPPHFRTSWPRSARTMRACRSAGGFRPDRESASTMARAITSRSRGALAGNVQDISTRCRAIQRSSRDLGEPVGVEARERFARENASSRSDDRVDRGLGARDRLCDRRAVHALAMMAAMSLFPVVHAGPGLIGHRVLERNDAVGTALAPERLSRLVVHRCRPPLERRATVRSAGAQCARAGLNVPVASLERAFKASGRSRWSAAHGL